MNFKTQTIIPIEEGSVEAGLRNTAAIIPANLKFAVKNKSPKTWKIFLVCIFLLGLALLLSACDYPGQDPPCVGANKNGPGCADPVQKIVDDENGGPWYVSWALDIIRSILSSASINAVRLGISIFWQVFTNLASTDFASCTSGSGGSSPTCTAASVFSTVNTVAFILLPLILFYKIFKSYFLGGLIESLHEGFISFFTRILVGGFAIYFLAVLVSGAFGISNILFDTIIGGAASLSDISKNLMGDCGNASACGSGIGSVGNVKNIGLLLFMFVICLAIAIIFIVLGLVFFLRTIIIFILFAISPLAVVAGLTEEFKPWFTRWLQSTQAMLIAPIPVAICFALVKAFTGTIPSANGDPAGFCLQLVYIGSFMFIGSVLMFKIAGEVGGFMFGAAAAGLGAITALGASSLGGAIRNSSQGSNKGNPDNTGATGENEANGGKSGSSVGTRPSSGVGSLSEASGNGSSSAGSSNGIGMGGFGSGTGGMVNAASTGGSGGADQQQRHLLNALRSLNESMSASVMSRSTITTTTSNSGRNQSGQAGNNSFASNLGYNMQSALLWSGNQAGVSAPYFRIGSSYGSGSSGNATGNTQTTTTNVNEQEENYSSNTQQVFGPEPYPGQSGGALVNPLPELPETREDEFNEPVNSGYAQGQNQSYGSNQGRYTAQHFPTLNQQRSTSGSPYSQKSKVEVILVPESYLNAASNRPRPALPAPPASLPPPSPPQSQRRRIIGAIPDPYGEANPRPILAFPEPGRSGENSRSGDLGSGVKGNTNNDGSGTPSDSSNVKE